MFLHGGWLHLIFNMWYMFIFGDNVEGRLGHGLFLAFYLGCGLIAAGAQYLLGPGSTVPTIGASGAIAGLLGAYAVCWPRARVLSVVPVFFFLYFVELPALFLLGFWFLIQLVQGATSLGVEFAHGGVAYWAHIGGFGAGALLIKLLPVSRRPRRAGRSAWR
jgi:membrane associated rhomboid family serine protease